MDDVQDFKVTDRESFAEFLSLLHNDLKTNPSDWENKTLDDFLEAMSRYTEDIQGYYNNKGPKGEVINADVPSWTTFADIIKGAKIYE